MPWRELYYLAERSGRAKNTVSHDFVTCRRSPEVSSTAFDAQPPDLSPVSLMDMGFAIIGPLARHRRLVSGSCSSARAFARRFFQARLAASVISRLRFTMTSPPSGCQSTFTLKLSHMLGTQQSGSRDIRVTQIVPHDPECMVQKLRKCLCRGLSSVRTSAKAACQHAPRAN